MQFMEVAHCLSLKFLKFFQTELNPKVPFLENWLCCNYYKVWNLFLCMFQKSFFFLPMKISNWISKLLVGLVGSISIDNHESDWKTFISRQFTEKNGAPLMFAKILQWLVMHMIFNILSKYFFTVSKLSFRNMKNALPLRQPKYYYVQKSLPSPNRLKCHLKMEKCSYTSRGS